ncbi:MAG: hypothetical protein COC10_12440 [Sphingobium sp.]|nr:MAG: hypothetical protein COC10_12440 [Sphingobium sp.]
MIRRLSLFAMLLSLAGCGPAGDDGVGGVSTSEARALNEAAAQLDARTGAVQDGDKSLNPAARAAAEADRHRQAPARPPRGDGET